MNATCTTVTAPAELKDLGSQSVFLGGGISGCVNWQEEMIELLRDFPGSVLNPRRDQWLGDQAFLREQIAWEKKGLEVASLRSFWFPPETFCPITLFELGQTIGANRPFVVGSHTDYVRRTNIKTQLELATPNVRLARSLPELAIQIRNHFDNRGTT